MKDKPKYVIIYYSSPRDGGHRELIYLQDGKLSFAHHRQIEDNFKKYKGLEIDFNFPFIRFFETDKNPIEVDKEIYKYLRILNPKPYHD